MLLRYYFAKLVMLLNFLIFIGIPFLCAAIIFKNKSFLIAGLVLGLIILIWIFSNAFKDFVDKLHASKADQDPILEKSVRRIAKSESFSKIQFWIFPNPKAKVKYWVGINNKIEVFLSQGALSILSEAELKHIFTEANQLQNNATERFRLKLSQNYENVHVVLNKLKGDSSSFRYWFLSFWLLPFEKTLKFSTHLL